jgi:hypothetical protein
MARFLSYYLVHHVTIKYRKKLPVFDSSVGRALSFSHEGQQFKSKRGHFVCLVIDPPSN